MAMEEKLESGTKPIAGSYGRTVEAFLEKFLAAIGDFHRHSPAGDPIKGSVRQLHDKLKETMAGQGKLSLSEEYGHIEVNGAPLPVEFMQSPIGAAFSFFMLENNIQACTFHNGCAEKDLEQFIEQLATYMRTRDFNLATTLGERNVRNIEIVPHVTFEPKTETGQTLERRHTSTEIADFFRAAPTFAPTPNHSGKGTATAGAGIEWALKSPPEKPFSERVPRSDRLETGMFQDTAPFPSMPSPISPNTTPLTLPDDSEPATAILTRPESRDSTAMIMRRLGDYSSFAGHPAGKVRLMVMARLGRHELDGAEVSILGDPEQTKTTSGDEGTSFFLDPGKFTVRVSYDAYQKDYAIEIGSGDREVQMDVDLMNGS